VAGLVDRSTVTAAAVLAGAACVPLSLASGWKAGTVHVGAVALALAYNLGLKATTLSVLCYAVSFGALPVFVAKGAPGAPSGPWWAATAAAALGVGAHILNTLPDRVDDLATGTFGLPLRLSVEANARLAGAAFFVAAGVLSFGSGQVDPLRLGAFVCSALCGLAIAVISARDARLAFRLTLVLAVLDVGLLLVVSR
jgi:4-hydroxybenzoate polyprenyltransferase